MNFSNVLLVYSSDDMRPNRLPAIYFDLEQQFIQMEKELQKLLVEIEKTLMAMFLSVKW